MDEEEIHSAFGGSRANRWLNCAGSVALCDSVPALPSSSWAKEGKLAHGLAAYCLTNGLHNVFAGMVNGRANYPDDMAPAVQKFLDTVYADLAKYPDAILHVEHKFVFAKIGDGKEVFGRNDVLIYVPSKGLLIVYEYKHGAGVFVPVDNNEQLKFYAAGAMLANPSWRFAKIEVVVVQPRFWNDDGEPVHRVTLNVVDLIDFASEIDLGVKKAKAVMSRVVTRDDLVTGSWCRWCDAATICPARKEEVLKAMLAPYENMGLITPDALPDVRNLDVEEIAQIMRGITVLEAWAAQVREFAEAHMIAGNLQIPGWKVVDKQGKRHWISADREVAGYLELLYGVHQDEVHPRKLIGLGDTEKLLKAMGVTKEEREAVFDRFTVKESSGQTIAPATDKRPAVNAAARDFAGINITV